MLEFLFLPLNTNLSMTPVPEPAPCLITASPNNSEQGLPRKTVLRLFLSRAMSLNLQVATKESVAASMLHIQRQDASRLTNSSALWNLSRPAQNTFKLKDSTKWSFLRTATSILLRMGITTVRKKHARGRRNSHSAGFSGDTCAFIYVQSSVRYVPSQWLIRGT